MILWEFLSKVISAEKRQCKIIICFLQWQGQHPALLFFYPFSAEIIKFKFEQVDDHYGPLYLVCLEIVSVVPELF